MNKGIKVIFIHKKARCLIFLPINMLDAKKTGIKPVERKGTLLFYTLIAYCKQQ